MPRRVYPQIAANLSVSNPRPKFPHHFPNPLNNTHIILFGTKFISSKIHLQFSLELHNYMNTFNSSTYNIESFVPNCNSSINKDDFFEADRTSKRSLNQSFDKDIISKKPKLQNLLNDIDLFNHSQILNSPASFPIQSSSFLSADHSFSDCFSDVKFQYGLMREKSNLYQPSPLPNLCTTEANVIDVPPYIDTSPSGSAILSAIKTPPLQIIQNTSSISTTSSAHLTNISPYPNAKYINYSNEKNGTSDKENKNFANKPIISYSTPPPFQNNDATSQKKWARWTIEEDELLKFAVSLEGLQNWKVIGDKYFMGTKKAVQCKNRWRKVSLFINMDRMLG